MERKTQKFLFDDRNLTQDVFYFQTSNDDNRHDWNFTWFQKQDRMNLFHYGNSSFPVIDTWHDERQLIETLFVEFLLKEKSSRFKMFGNLLDKRNWNHGKKTFFRNRIYTIKFHDIAIVFSEGANSWRHSMSYSKRVWFLVL